MPYRHMLHTFMTMGRDEWSASTASHFTPRAKAPGTHKQEAQ